MTVWCCTPDVYKKTANHWLEKPVCEVLQILTNRTNVAAWQLDKLHLPGPGGVIEIYRSATNGHCGEIILANIKCVKYNLTKKRLAFIIYIIYQSTSFLDTSLSLIKLPQVLLILCTVCTVLAKYAVTMFNTLIHGDMKRRANTNTAGLVWQSTYSILRLI